MKKSVSWKQANFDKMPNHTAETAEKVLSKSKLAIMKEFRDTNIFRDSSSGLHSESWVFSVSNSGIGIQVVYFVLVNRRHRFVFFVSFMCLFSFVYACPLMGAFSTVFYFEYLLNGSCHADVALSGMKFCFFNWWTLQKYQFKASMRYCDISRKRSEYCWEVTIHAKKNL